MRTSFTLEFTGLMQPMISIIKTTLMKAQVKRNKKFWARFLGPGSQGQKRTEADWRFALRLAERWDTCACGSINDGLPRNGKQEFEPHSDAVMKEWCPIDRELRTLGINFFCAIGNQNLKISRQIFSQIQHRAGQVLYEHGMFQPTDKSGV